jgi:hypothetical protein
MPEMEPRVLCMLGRCSITGSHMQPQEKVLIQRKAGEILLDLLGRLLAGIT